MRSCVLVALVLVVTGCGSVRAYEKESLAHRAMAAEVDPACAAVRAHIAAAREAGLDPDSTGGGGCGCN